MMRKAAVVAAALLIVSCKTGAHFPIPGEGAVTRSSLAAEYMAIADAYAELEKYDKAAPYYKRAMQDESLYWTAIYKLGRMYALSKNWPEAEKIYKRLLERDAQNVSVRMSLAYIQAMSGDLAGAKAAYKTLVDENPQNETVLVNFIAVLLSQKDTAGAEESIALLKQGFPESASLADYEKRLSDLKKADEEKASKGGEDADAKAAAKDEVSNEGAVAGE
ncbi:lipopolysaccharide assembly protein LapB [Treponema sp. Marseille-Q4523]|uniref:tetratricopeptide repeat protein n=1 Tax=Treponema sp. Marseille-Q4523 TaxID=2810610 RepID=UPI0019611354|nr:tetratricopeptide repeat protein [Treponema sp. Marseille-Q4523]MBM7022609.1 tetratricopeptide repeat protein [Treponema sp. Marseille-Q4523]